MVACMLVGKLLHATAFAVLVATIEWENESLARSGSERAILVGLSCFD